MKIIKTKTGYILQKKGEQITLTIEEAAKFNERFEKHCEEADEKAQSEWIHEKQEEINRLKSMGM